MLTCERCKVKFTNEYLLLKHQNRKIPCNVIFECIRCKKILATQNSLERHYNNKKPCIEVPKYIKPVKNTNIKLKSKLILLEKQEEIQKEKTKQKEEDRKFKLEIEKEKSRKKEIELNIQKEKKLLLEKKNEEIRIKKEEIEIRKKEKELAIKEEKRLKRKEARQVEDEKRDALEMEVQREAMLEFEREQLKIQLAAEKTKQIKLKAQMQKDKIQALKERKDLEYSRAFQKTRNHQESIKLYAENNVKKLEKKKEIDLEILKAKTESRKTLEVMKMERKEQTPQIINNNVTITIINNCINHIKETHIDKLSIDFDQMQSTALEYLKQNIISHDENKSARHLIHIFNKYDTCNGILDHIIRMAYNNPEREDKRCIWYMKDPEYYFAGTLNDNEKGVKLIEFEKYLLPLVKTTLSTTVVKMTDMVAKYVKMGCNYEKDGGSEIYLKHQNLLFYQQNVLPFTNECLDDIKKMTDKVFEIKSPAL